MYSQDKGNKPKQTKHTQVYEITEREGIKMYKYDYKKRGVYGEYFCGNKISEHGLKYNRVDYGTLAKAFDAVLNNTIYSEGWNIGYGWEQESGYIDNTEKIDELNELIESKRDKINELDEYGDASEILELEDIVEQIEEEIDELQAEMDYPPDVFQWYIVDTNGAEILEDIDEIVFYHDALDMYLWGVTHWGTSWDYVLTDIPCNTGEY